jgi:hypothetical protein
MACWVDKCSRNWISALRIRGMLTHAFPLLIPPAPVAEGGGYTVQGFAKECAVVTHHRLATDASGKLGTRQPAGGADGNPPHLRNHYWRGLCGLGCDPTATCRF